MGEGGGTTLGKHLRHCTIQKFLFSFWVRVGWPGTTLSLALPLILELGLRVTNSLIGEAKKNTEKGPTVQNDNRKVFASAGIGPGVLQLKTYMCNAQVEM